jgi:hypothetical protein
MAHAYNRPYSSDVYNGTELDSITYGVPVPASPSAVPVPPTQGFPVSINGRNYMIDTSFEPYRREAFRHKSIAAQRQSLHFTNIPDDGTISTEGLWRREARDWALGAGQIYLDRNKSDSARFYRSKGVDPWQQWQTTLLPDTLAQYTSTTTTTGIKAIRCSNYVYVADGSNLYFTQAWSGSTTAVINPSTNFTSLSGTTMTVGSTSGFPSAGSILVDSSSGRNTYTYTGKTGTTFTGVTNIFGSGTPYAGGYINYEAQYSETKLYVTSLPSNVGNYIQVGTEQLKITASTAVAGVGLQLTVARAQNGTTAINILGGTAVQAVPSLVSGTSGTILDICSDGYQVYILTTNGLYMGVGGNTDGVATMFTFGATLTGLAGGTPGGIIAWVGGRLIMALNGITGIGSGSTVVPSGSSLFDLTFASTVTGGAIPNVDGYITGSSGVNASATTIPIDWLQHSLSTGDVLQIEGEQIRVTGGTYIVGATSFTCTRGYGGTTATAHAQGTPVYKAAKVLNALTTQQQGLLYTHPNPQWLWSGITAGSSQVYFAGYSDGTATPDQGTIYRSTVSPATASAPPPTIGNLSYPVVALPMPGGEYPTAIRNYLNFIFVGTNKGIRMCETLNALDPTGNTGDLKSGPLVPNITQPVMSPVTAIIGYDRYVYFAWNNYDSTSSGLGRLDLTSFIDTLAPAYASDLMITDQGTVNWLDWDPITNSPLMSFDSTTGYSKIYTQDPINCVASGNIDSGLITYGIPDYKNAVSIDVNIANVTGATNSEVGFTLGIDDQTSISAGTYSGAATKYKLPFNQQFGEQFRVTTNITAAVSETGTRISPTLNRWTLKALPGIPSGILISAVLLMYEPTEVDGQVVYLDPYTEYAYLESLRQSQTVVTYVEGPFNALVTVDAIDWLPERRRPTVQGGYHGDMVVSLKTVTG